jgi:hypothetical protein
MVGASGVEPVELFSAYPDCEPPFIASKHSLALTVQAHYTLIMYIRLTILTLTLACSADSEKSHDKDGLGGDEDTAASGESSGSEAGGDGADEGDAGGGEPIREIPDDAIVTEEGSCYDESVLVAADGVVFDELEVLSYPHALTLATMLGSVEDVEGFQAAYGIEIDAGSVNFNSHSILYAQVGASNTCGIEEPVAHVVDIDGAAHLSLELWVPDGTCEDVCDMSWTEYAAVAVKREPNLTVCARRIDFCE